MKNYILVKKLIFVNGKINVTKKLIWIEKQEEKYFEIMILINL